LQDQVESFDHFAIAVRDIERALPMVTGLGGTFHQGADHKRNGFRWIQFRLPGGACLELLQSLTTDSFLTRFLDSGGEGLHHITFRVKDVAQVQTRLIDNGLVTTGFHLHPDWSEIFVHPKSAHGVLVQLAAWPDAENWRGYTLEDVLNGRSLDDT
jgi:methylmalonyl-CoA/ethylmalonyl-CoA epimerase